MTNTSFKWASATLGRKLFQGGEGAIHAVYGRSDVYAKI